VSARSEIASKLWLSVPSNDNAEAKAKAEQMLDAYRAEVLAEAKVETVAWLVKKSTEQKAWDAGVLASKVDRGAVRAFLGTVHYQDAMDAHRAEVLREAAAELIAFCPDHGNRDTSFIACQCPAAEDLLSKAGAR
jgi:hypothetical protein